MNEISAKNETFIIEGLQGMYILDDIKNSEKKIKELVNQYNNGENIEYEALVKNLEDANYNETKISDIVSSIKMYYSKIQYEEVDILSYINSVKYNAFINNVTIKKTLANNSIVPNFNVGIVNLGFNGISSGDMLVLSFYSDSVNEVVNKEYTIDKTILDIKGNLIFTVSNLISPKTPHEYNLSLSIKHGNVIYGNLIIKGINVKEGIVV